MFPWKYILRVSFFFSQIVTQLSHFIIFLFFLFSPLNDKFLELGAYFHTISALLWYGTLFLGILSLSFVSNAHMAIVSSHVTNWCNKTSLERKRALQWDIFGVRDRWCVSYSAKTYFVWSLIFRLKVEFISSNDSLVLDRYVYITSCRLRNILHFIYWILKFPGLGLFLVWYFVLEIVLSMCIFRR